MKFYVDNKLIRKLTATSDAKERKFLYSNCIKAIADPEEHSLEFVLDWSSLLEYLDFGSLFENYQEFNDQNKIFSSVIEGLKMDSEKEVVVYLYDQIFVECLTQVKRLPQIRPEVLIDRILDKRLNPIFFDIKDPFYSSLEGYEKRLRENPYETVHDLTLYLAWDRVCVYLAAVFDEPSLHIRNGLETLKECLIESFQHIAKQGRTTPGFFRLIEALYAYQMKEENLQNYTDSEWQLLCQSLTILQSRDYIADASYIDGGLIDSRSPGNQVLNAMVLEASDRVKSSVSLVRYFIEKLRIEDPAWEYVLCHYEIVCLKDNGNDLSFDHVICG